MRTGPGSGTCGLGPYHVASRGETGSISACQLYNIIHLTLYSTRSALSIRKSLVITPIPEGVIASAVCAAQSAPRNLRRNLPLNGDCIVAKDAPGSGRPDWWVITRDDRGQGVIHRAARRPVGSHRPPCRAVNHALAPIIPGDYPPVWPATARSVFCDDAVSVEGEIAAQIARRRLRGADCACNDTFRDGGNHQGFAY